MPLISAGRTLAAAATALLATAPAALATQSTVSGSISPVKVRPGTPLALSIGFTITRENGQSDTLRQVVLDFPPNAVANGRLFPACMPDTINARKSFGACPKGSKIGTGTLLADVPGADQYNVPGTVTLFNGTGGNSVTVHVFVERPAVVSQAFSASLKKTSGRYGYRLTANVPESLQEINDGWFVEVKRFSTRVSGTIKVKGRTRGYIEAKTCPKSGSVPIAGAFDFARDASPTSALGVISCRS